MLILLVSRNCFTFFSMSMKVPKIVEEAKEALEDGYCVVIGLQTTGEVSFLFFPLFFSVL